MKQSRPTLRAQKITKTFGTDTVLAGIDLELAPGEWLGILGERVGEKHLATHSGTFPGCGAR